MPLPKRHGDDNDKKISESMYDISVHFDDIQNNRSAIDNMDTTAPVQRTIICMQMNVRQKNESLFQQT